MSVRVYLCVNVCVNAPFDFKYKGEKIMECNQARAILCGNLDTLRDCVGFCYMTNRSLYQSTKVILYGASPLNLL